MGAVKKYRIRDNVTLAGGGALQTQLGVPCLGAKQVIWVVTASNANAPSACSVIGTPSAGGGGVFTPAGLTFSQNVSGNALNGGGMVAHIVQTQGGYLPWGYIKLTITPHASLDITGLTIDAYVVYDLEAEVVMREVGQVDAVPA